MFAKARSYEILTDKLQIFNMKKPLLLLWVCMWAVIGMALAQERTITGTVNEAGEPMPGVAIQIKGTTRGTISDISGKFSLVVPSNESVLTFSFIGYKTQEVKIGAQSILNVNLQADAQELEEVVVTGYGSATKQSLSAAVSSVSSEQVKSVVTPDVSQALQGQAAGVQVTQGSGQPGSMGNIRVRGTGSITAGADPLYVIDGVIVSNSDMSSITSIDSDGAGSVKAFNPLASINPNDILSMNVLKDAAATALYGARAANGVIVITTKSGKAGKTTFNLKTQYGFTNVNMGGIEMMNSEQLWNYERTMLANAGYDEAFLNDYRPASMKDHSTNWGDHAFQRGITQNYELSASGGNEKTTFFTSGGYFKQQGTVIGSDFERLSGRLNLKHNPFERLQIDINTLVTATKQNNAGRGNTFASPIMGFYANSPYDNPFAADGSLVDGNPATMDWYSSSRTNFLYEVANNNSISNSVRLLPSLKLSYDILDNLTVSSQNSVDYQSVKESIFQAPNTLDGRAVNGRKQNSNNYLTTYTNTNLVRYNTTFGDKHSFDALAGTEFQYTNRSYNLAMGTGFGSSDLPNLGSAAKAESVGGAGTEYKFFSLLTQANYNYDSRYYLTASYRRDGSSRFAPANRYGDFFSVGGSWVLSNEAFLANTSEWLSNLKLRASYGTTGNAEVSTNPFIADFGYMGLFDFDANYLGRPGARPTQIANDDLTWEKTGTFNAGVDVSFWNRLNMSVEVYHKNTTDMLLAVPVSMTSGFVSKFENIGEMQNKGLEISLNSKNIVKGPLTWNTDFNISFNRNKVTKLRDGEDFTSPLTSTQRISEGRDMFAFFMPEWAGVDPANGDPLWYTADGGTTNSYSKAERRFVGSALPKFTGGLSNTFAYKGFDASVLFTFSVGGKVYNRTAAWYDGSGYDFGDNKIVAAGEDFWQKPGDVVSRPKPIYGGNKNSHRTSTRYLEDGSYLRLRSVSLGYTLPSNIAKKVKMGNIRVYAQGNNLWTLTNYSGMDPEMELQGTEYYRYPNGRTFTFGLDLQF